MLKSPVSTGLTNHRNLGRAMTNFWKVIGVLLLIWVVYDLYAGYTILHEVIYREESPTLYWGGLGLWLVLAISCFYSWESEDY